MSVVFIKDNVMHTIMSISQKNTCKLPLGHKVIGNLEGFDLITNIGSEQSIDHKNGVFIRSTNLRGEPKLIDEKVFFELGAIKRNVKEANEFCIENKGFGLIATDNNENLFLACIEASFSV